jgi:transcriptional regulator GlxA family with amidase domain
MAKPMKKVYLFAFENGIASTVIGPLEIFHYANTYLTVALKSMPCFDVRVATLDGKPVTCSGCVSIKADCSLAEIDGADLVIVCSPGLISDGVMIKHLTLFPGLKRLYAAGSTLAGICTGTFFLAESGILNGKTATTHWDLAATFLNRYPEVKLNTSRIITDEGDLICAGGVYSALDLALYLVEKYASREVAINCAKTLIIDAGRESQSRYSIFTFQKKHKDDQILNIQEWMEANYKTQFTIEGIAASHGMSVRNFKRRFKKATGDSPLVYLQRLRIEAARHLLETGNKTVNEIAVSIGYEDTDFFRKLFKRYLDVTPQAYRQKFKF